MDGEILLGTMEGFAIFFVFLIAFGWLRPAYLVWPFASVRLNCVVSVGAALAALWLRQDAVAGSMNWTRRGRRTRG